MISISAKTRVVNAVTKYDVQFDTFLLVTWAARIESDAANETRERPICATNETTTPTATHDKKPRR